MTKIIRRVMPLLTAVLILCMLSSCKKKEVEQSGLILDYASKGVVEMSNPGSFQKALDEAQAEALDSMFGLNYENDAYSSDGKTFSCYIGNSRSNKDDIFIAVYKDSALTEQLYISQLLRPGTAYETIELDEALKPGDYTVYVPHTKIRLIDGVQTIVGQVVVTMDFHVVPD